MLELQLNNDESLTLLRNITDKWAGLEVKTRGESTRINRPLPFYEKNKRTKLFKKMNAERVKLKRIIQKFGVNPPEVIEGNFIRECVAPEHKGKMEYDYRLAREEKNRLINETIQQRSHHAKPS